MQDGQHHHGAGAPVMQAADQPAAHDILADEIDRVVGMVGRRDVVHRQERAGDGLDGEDEHRGAAEGVEPGHRPLGLGDAAGEERGPDLVEAGALAEPVPGDL